MKPVNLDSYDQWRFVQDWLSGWMLRHKDIDPEDLEKFESVIEMIQEGQPVRPDQSVTCPYCGSSNVRKATVYWQCLSCGREGKWTPSNPDNWMFPPEGP